MERYRDRLLADLGEAIEAKQRLLTDTAGQTAFALAVDTIVRTYRAGGRLYLAGNGGSAADAQHLAAEFVCKMADPRRAIPAEALTVDTSTLTAIGNDFGFDRVFARQIEAKLGPDDAFLAITTSGNSTNILLALEECRRIGAKSILFTGRDGGKARALADVTVLAPGGSTNRIQEIHILLCHTLCACVEAELCAEDDQKGPLKGMSDARLRGAELSSRAPSTSSRAADTISSTLG